MFEHDYYLTWSADPRTPFDWSVIPWESLPDPKPVVPQVAPEETYRNRVYVPIDLGDATCGSFRLTWSSDVRDGLGWDVYTRGSRPNAPAAA